MPKVRAHRRSWSRNANSGFTLVEFLVTAAIFAIVGQAFTKFFSSQMRLRNDIDAQAEAHQGLTAGFDALTRDVRLAGACLPIQPFFVPLSGTNSGTLDRITVRTGTVSQTTTCVQAALTTAVAAGATTVQVNNLTGFTVDGWAYIVGAIPGEFFHVTALSGSSGAGSLTTDTALAQGYPLSAGVYALEERSYAIDSATYGVPTLTRSINRRPAVPIASGIESLDIQYRLNQGCPSCTLVDLPANNPAWNQVSEVILTMTARSLRNLTTGSLFRESMTVAVQPRNILTLRSS